MFYEILKQQRLHFIASSHPASIDREMPKTGCSLFDLSQKTTLIKKESEFVLIFCLSMLHSLKTSFSGHGSHVIVGLFLRC